MSGLLVEGDVADEIEGVEVLAQLLGDGVERQALGFQFLDDRLLALGRLPALAGNRRGWRSASSAPSW